MFRHFSSKYLNVIFTDLRGTLTLLQTAMVDNSLTILYGSQTGQAKAIAEEICEQTEGCGLKPRLLCLSTTDKKFSLEKEEVVVFVISTTGDGEPPDTVGKFWRRLRKKTLSTNHLNGLRYTILGLGDSNYTNFCNCSKGINSRLMELGAKHFYSPGFADDCVGLEVVVEPWVEGLLSSLKKLLGPNSETNNDGEPVSEKLTTPTTICDENGICDSAPPKQSPDKGDSELHNGPTMVEQRLSEPTSSVSSLQNSVAPLSSCDLSTPLLPAYFLSIGFTDEVHSNQSPTPWQGSPNFPGMASPVISTTIASAIQMTRGDAVKKSLAVTFDTGDVTLDYIPGDAFGILCPNNEKEVNELVERLGYQGQEDRLFTVNVSESSTTAKRAKGRPEHIPELCTIKHALSTCLEIRSVPRKAFLRVLCEYTSDAAEKRRLQELCSKQGATDYSTFIREPNVSFTDILNAFPSCKPPFERLLEHLPRLLPRPYSVSCSPLVNPKILRVVFNVVTFSAIESVRYERRGVCTGWLETLTRHLTAAEKVDEKESIQEQLNRLSLNSLGVDLFRRNSSGFHLPDDPRVPLIMVGPGTGVAPFIGFLQHRQYQMNHASEDIQFGATWLFYGCRHKDRDFLFKEELKTFEKNAVLTKLLVSFSRDTCDETSSDTDEHMPKYVQDNIRIWEKDLCDLIYNCGAYIYVCGDAKNMAKNVLETFVNMLQDVKGLQYKEAQKEIWSLRQQQRYVEDVWT